MICLSIIHFEIWNIVFKSDLVLLIFFRIKTKTAKFTKKSSVEFLRNPLTNGNFEPIHFAYDQRDPLTRVKLVENLI